MESSDVSGGQVMAEENQQDKAEDTVKKRKKPREYRRFERLLKQVIKAPPMKQTKRQGRLSGSS
jgi:hypothetical protein